MCIICDKTYDDNTIELYCCRNVAEIPFLPELKYLYCDNTKITEIPVLPKLEYLDCDNTKITEIPVLPKLKELDCENTKITALPKIPNCYIESDNCVWLNLAAGRINKLVKLQKWIRSNINKRNKIIHAAMHTHRDLVYVLNV